MAVVMTVSVLTYAYVVPFVISGQASQTIDGGVEIISSGVEGVDDMIGGSLGDTTELIRGQDASPKSELVAGKTSRIIDGDTLVINDEKIRLALVNTPERGQAGYSEATQFTARACPIGTNAWYDVDSGQPRDPFGRIIAQVWCGDQFGDSLNEMLVKNGHAVIFERYCNQSEFSSEDWAMACTR